MPSSARSGSPEEGSGRDFRGSEGTGPPSKLWGIAVFGVIGAAVTTLAVGQLRRTLAWWYTQLSRVQSTSSQRTFTEEAWRRYNRRLQEEYEEELERVRRIRHMQSVFNRERNKFRMGYESWRENEPGPGGYQHTPREDWYWKTETFYSEFKPKGGSTPKSSTSYPRSHHYGVLGLDRSRAAPYTDAEIKTAFRAKAMQYHPDQNQQNKEAAEEKFKEVMKSYEAIKQERQDESRQ